VPPELLLADVCSEYPPVDVASTRRMIHSAERISTRAPGASTVAGIYARSGFVRAQLSTSDSLNFQSRPMRWAGIPLPANHRGFTGQL
jgi:hypothetical protein